MRYYSDVTKRFYNTVKECEKAENQFMEEQTKKEAEALAKSNARKDAAKKVESAYEAFTAAKKEYQKQLSDFCKEYGYYHISFGKDGVRDWIDSFWDSWL